MKSEPLISIICPSYNKEKYISETINSVINQVYANWELLIIDDKSTDQTSEIVNQFVNQDQRIKFFINSKNKGANFNRNYGLNKATGDYIIFLDADDILNKDCLNNRIIIMHDSGLDFCVFTLCTFNIQIGDNNFLWQPNSKNPINDFLSHKLPWQTMQLIWNKIFLIKLGGFDEQFKRLQDVEIHTRALLSLGVNYKQFLGKPDCYYRIDINRLNYSNYDFMFRWVESANLYYLKFFLKVKLLNIHSYLLGTIYQTYLQLLIRYKNGSINKTEFNNLEKKLFLDLNIRKSKYIFFKISKVFNLLPFRIPGINFLINKTLINF